MCKCKAKWWALGAVAAVVAAVAGVRGCGGAGSGGGEDPQQPADDIKGAAERTQTKIEERMADTNYVAGLDALAKRYDDLNAKRAEAMRELAAAKAQAGGAEGPQGEIREKETAGGQRQGAEAGQQESDSRVAAAEEKLRKIDEEIEANRRLAVGFISTRLREQGEKGVGAELEAAAAERKAREKSDPQKAP
ncbi:MAG: hypothetical protein ILM98_12135 [Kiritimatiellae bacterium]|nr:hypothetical protein [Kiritimatiellia bacterium]